jgi:starch synthase
MRVVFATAEVYSLAKTGGLADVSAALPTALARLGVDVRIVLPAYPDAVAQIADPVVEAQHQGENGSTRLIAGRLPGADVPVWLVDCPPLFRREGNPYQDDNGRQWPDNAQRFAFLSRAAAQIARGELVPGWQADVVHANDWHTGLLPLFLKEGSLGSAPPALLTLHNLAYQGLFPAETMSAIGLAPHLFDPDGIEFFGQVSFLKAGIRFSERLTTVSACYASEILTPEHGCGLDGLLKDRAVDLTGIRNGVDYDIWNPEKDRWLPTRFGPHHMGGKLICKTALQRELGLAVDPDIPLIIWVSRIDYQKMADVALEALPALLQRPVQFALIGDGDKELQTGLGALARDHAGQIAVRVGYEEPLAHRYYAAGDILLHPSRFEPCGLTPLYGLRYGALPVVRGVGGLAETIVDATERAIRDGSANGFSFQDANAGAMLACIDRALATYSQPVIWRKIQQHAMQQHFGWQASARQYLDLYRQLAPTAPLVDVECAEEMSGRADPRGASRNAQAAA